MLSSELPFLRRYYPMQVQLQGTQKQDQDYDAGAVNAQWFLSSALIEQVEEGNYYDREQQPKLAFW